MLKFPNYLIVEKHKCAKNDFYKYTENENLNLIFSWKLNLNLKVPNNGFIYFFIPVSWMLPFKHSSICDWNEIYKTSYTCLYSLCKCIDFKYNFWKLLKTMYYIFAYNCTSIFCLPCSFVGSYTSVCVLVMWVRGVGGGRLPLRGGGEIRGQQVPGCAQFLTSHLPGLH